MSKFGAKAYHRTKVTTANRGDILILLYERAIEHMNLAIECIENKDIAGKGFRIGKAHDIVNELSASLDLSIGGEVAASLESLYQFIAEKLIEANIHSQRNPLDISIKIMENLLEGWKIAVEESKKSGVLD